MEYWLLYVVAQLIVAAFTYKKFQQVRPEPPQPNNRILQSAQYKSKQALKPSRPATEPLKPGVQMVGGKAVLIKSPTPPMPLAAQTASVPPPPPPPSIHSKLNPVKAKPSALIQRIPTPIPTPGIDVPDRVLIKLDRYTYDRDISNRLVMNVANKNPGKDGTWCAEKALWDIERDRQ